MNLKIYKLFNYTNYLIMFKKYLQYIQSKAISFYFYNPNYIKAGEGI